jgi:hypothetical protein
MISAVLMPELQKRFPERGLRIGSAPEACAVFPALHPEVGDILIYDDGDELTLVAGKFTHGHFASYDDSLSDDKRADRIVDEVVSFLEELFADRIILWGSHEGGGGWYRAEKGSAFQQRGNEYVWSGPLFEKPEP